MKYLFIQGVFFLFCISCNQDEYIIQQPIQSVSVTAIADITDKKLLWPKSNPILELYHCDKHPDAECRFNLTVISDKKTNPSYSAYLADGATTEKQNTTDDMQYRKRKIISFYQTVRTVITDFYKEFDTTQSLNYSECWVTVCNTLEKLATDKSEQKYLLIYSDLLEHSTINAYGLSGKTAIEEIASYLQRLHAVPQNLTGVTVVVVYNPFDRNDDIKFNKMFAVYKLLLEKNGAVVRLQTNDSFFEL
jgi:hypothetical protein